MIVELKQFLAGIFYITRREQVTKAAESIFASIHNNTIPALDQLLKSESGSVVNGNDLLHNIIQVNDVKCKDNMDFFSKLKDFFTEVLKEEKNILKLIETDVNEFVTDKGSNARELAIMKFIADIGSASYFTLDLVYLMLLDEQDTDLSKKKIADVKATIPDLISVYSKYVNVTEFVKSLSKVSQTVVNQPAASESMIERLMGTEGKLLKLAQTNGFINNPIYHIRMWMVDKEIEKYEGMKEKKKLIELKLLDLKLSDNNENNQKLKKQIKYYEEKLAILEYDITQIEADK